MLLRKGRSCLSTTSQSLPHLTKCLPPQKGQGIAKPQHPKKIRWYESNINCQTSSCRTPYCGRHYLGVELSGFGFPPPAIVKSQESAQQGRKPQEWPYVTVLGRTTRIGREQGKSRRIRHHSPEYGARTAKLSNTYPRNQHLQLML